MPDSMLDPRAFHRDAVVADMHAHPSLKTFLAGEKFHLPHRPNKNLGIFTMQVCLSSLRKGDTDIQVSTIYIPEKGIADDCIVMEGLSKVMSRLKRGFHNVDDMTREVMEHFEQAIARAAEEPGGRVPRIVRSKSELKQALANNDIAVIHAIEGAHSLAGKIENVDDFYNRGVCMLTLAHFYENEAVAPVDGIPYDYFLRKVGCFRQKKDFSKGLTDFGRQVVERMIELGMIVDLTHCTPKARREIVEINGGRRPLAYSHAGVNELMPHELNPTKEELRAVADTGGIVGVILMPYYLTVPKQQKGFQPIIDTVKCLVDCVGADGIGIGSDFDGFTDPPDDLREPADFPKLTEHLLEAFGPDTTQKILGANFLRVLKSGWGRE